MQQDTVLDPRNESGQVWSIVWRCLNCGEVFDQVILQNRGIKPQPTYGKARIKSTTPLSSLHGKG